MPRTKTRKTERGTKDISIYEQAYEEVNNGNLSIRAASKKYGLCHVSLFRFNKKKKEIITGGTNSSVNIGYRAWNKVFTEDQEQIIEDYIIEAANIYYGFSPKEMRRFSYELAKKYQLSIPPQWEDIQMATEDWFSRFMKRHPRLSLRSAQPTSLSRATSFNKTNVNLFFDNLQKVMDRHKFEAKDIYNIDETGITTVQKPNRIVTKRGTRQVGALTSAERGSLVTVSCAVNAVGNFVPPMFVFPRLRYQEHFVRDGPIGSIGSGNASGWMQEKDFVIFLKHFQKYTCASTSQKILLLLDNHSSHISIQSLDYCSENGIVMLSFPPHCSHKLQPLDRSVYGPLKKAVNTSCDAWMRSNPGKTMSIYNIPSIVATALPMALTPSNIQAGFRCTGIYPYNRSIFTELDFAPSYVSDRPAPSTEIINENDVVSAVSTEGANESISFATLTSSETTNSTYCSASDKTSNQAENEPVPSTSSSYALEEFAPEKVRPFPKAPPRKQDNRGKKKRKSAIYTDTPEKETIRKEYEEKKKGEVKRNFSNSEPKKNTMKQRKVNKSIRKKKMQKSDSDDDDDHFCLVCVEPFRESKPGEKWVQCMDCKKWSHEECTNQDAMYICHHCDGSD